MPKSLSKAKMLSELCDKTGIRQKDLAKVLDALTEIVYREAVRGIAIPGLCKFTVVHRRAVQRWNPALKKRLLIGEHNVLKVVPVKKARMAVAPRPEGMVQILPDAPVQSRPAEAQAGLAAQPDIPQKAAPETAASPNPPAPQARPAGADLGNILFSCPKCNNPVMAETGQGGMTGECPTCQALIKIPAYEKKRPLKPKLATGSTAPANVDRRSVTIRMDVSEFAG